MKKVTIILKSGARLSFKCREFEVTYDKSTGDVNAYKGNGFVGFVREGDVYFARFYFEKKEDAYAFITKYGGQAGG